MRILASDMSKLAFCKVRNHSVEWTERECALIAWIDYMVSSK
jgi:hypothetical protein